MRDYEIRSLLMNAIPLQEVHISNDGSGHFQIIAVGEIFNGMNCLKKQQIVYAPLIEYIGDNRIHALSIKAYTPREWDTIEKTTS